MKKKIFIVEDDPDISELMKVIIEKEGYVVKMFLDSKKILTSALKEKPALILMDLWINGTDGTRIIKNLKRKKDIAKIPIIIVSAKTALDKTVKHTGADGFLSKPFDIKDLVAQIRQFV